MTVVRNALFVAGLAVTAAAQNPAADEPYWREAVHEELCWQQPAPSLEGREIRPFFEQGVSLLEAGWSWRAWQSFREVVARDPEFVPGWLGMALCARAAPRSAALYVHRAWQVRDQGGAAAAELATAFADCFAAKERPRSADDACDQLPPADELEKLVERLREIEGYVPAQRLAALVQPGTPTRGADGLQLRAVHAWLAERAQLPFVVPGYRELLARSGSDFAPELLPRHPHFAQLEGPPPRVPLRLSDRDRAAPQRVGPLRWQPRMAGGLQLPRGLGGTRSLTPGDGKPKLLVFFLGFGCVHCIEQLGALAPAQARFHAAGLEIVTVGTDDADQVKASYQMADENGQERLPFDVLCDPSGVSFKRWGAWDQFDDEALHGTYLIDGRGRVLWQDISIEPFLDVEFLLAESQRLLAAWRDVPLDGE